MRSPNTPRPQDPEGSLPQTSMGRVDSLLARGEGTHVEFKVQIPHEKKLARLLAAMANSGGGTILVGVTDDGRVRGVEQPEHAAAEVRSIAWALVDPPAQLHLMQATHEGRDVLVVEVAAANGPAVRLVLENTRRTYLRVNDQARPAHGSAAFPNGGRGMMGIEERMAGLEKTVRNRFRQASKAQERFSVREYARLCNTSERRARRDLTALASCFLVAEIERNLYEVVKD